MRFLRATAHHNAIVSNRTEYKIGSIAAISYVLERVDSDHDPYAIPARAWTKDGKFPLRNGTERSLDSSNNVLSAKFRMTITSADSGVYQCILFDTDRAEIFAPHPIRIDTGENFILRLIIVLAIIITIMLKNY